MGPFWDYWYFHIPNYVLAAVTYTILGRLLLGLFVPRDWDNYIWRAFCRLTDPLVVVVGVITPRMLPFPIVLLLAAFWAFVLRALFYALMAGAGLAPTAGLSP